jgi:hypothetical protein
MQFVSERCSMQTPLGLPVDPEVNSTYAREVSDGAASNLVSEARRRSREPPEA